MKILLSILTLIISISAFAVDLKMTQEEFLTKLDNKSISLERTPMLPFNQNVLQEILKGQRAKYPAFKDQMFYVAYIDSTNYRYFIFYEWYDRGCIYGSSEVSKYKGLTDKDKWSAAGAEASTYSKIDNKYCEQALGFTIPSSKGLIAIPDKVKNLLNKE